MVQPHINPICNNTDTIQKKPKLNTESKEKSSYDINEFMRHLHRLKDYNFIRNKVLASFANSGVERRIPKILSLLFDNYEIIDFKDFDEPLLPTVSHVNSLFSLSAAAFAEQLVKEDDKDQKLVLESIPYAEIQRELMLQMTYFTISTGTTSDLAIIFLQQRNYIQAFQCILNMLTPPFFTETSCFTR